MSTQRHLFAVPAAAYASLALALLQAGCTTASAKSAGDGTTQDGGPSTADGGSAAGTSLSCGEIFTCAAKCPDNDEACETACLDSGSTGGKAAATALVSCYTTNSCADAATAQPQTTTTACLTAKCTPEIEACTSEQAAPSPVSSPPATGVVPASLVGEWEHFYSPTNHLDKFTFDASGGAKRYLTTSSTFGACPTSAISDATGTVVFTDTKVTFFQTGGTDVWSTCGAPGVPRPTPTGSYEYLWSFDATGRLVLTSLAASCADAPDSSSCTKAYDKK